MLTAHCFDQAILKIFDFHHFYRTAICKAAGVTFSHIVSFKNLMAGGSKSDSIFI